MHRGARVAENVPVETDARTKFGLVTFAISTQEWSHNGVELAELVKVVWVGVEFVAQPEVESEVLRHLPGILDISGDIVVDVVKFGFHSCSQDTAAQRDIEVVDL